MTIKTPLTPFGRQRKPYKKNFVLFESATPGTYTLDIKAGTFEISIIGAGGGGGGGSYKSGHKHPGGGGGSGAGFIGNIKLVRGIYYLVVGACGAGGPPGSAAAGHGGAGGASILQKDDVAFIIAGGGNGGWGARADATDCSGGILTINSELQIISSTLQTNGNAGVSSYGGAAGAAVDGVHGAGNIGVYKEAGLNGNPGFIKLVYIGT